MRDVTESLILNYKKSFNHLANATQRRKLYSLSSLFDFALKRKIIEKNPLKYVIKPKIKNQIQSHILNETEINQILKFTKESISKKSSAYVYQRIRYLLFVTLFNTAFRLKEITLLQFSHFSFINGKTKVTIPHAKGSEEHFIFVSEKLNRVVQDFKEEFSLEDHSFLFLSRDFQKASSTKRIYNIVKDTINKCQIKKIITPHSCRASVATLLHHKGIPIVQIQKFLNHKDINTTSVYLRKSEEMKDQASLRINIEE